jgi:hypothetical protein
MATNRMWTEQGNLEDPEQPSLCWGTYYLWACILVSEVWDLCPPKVLEHLWDKAFVLFEFSPPILSQDPSRKCASLIISYPVLLTVSLNC